MKMTRIVAFASMTAVLGGAMPPAALAAVIPPLSPAKPAPANELPPPVPGTHASPAASWYVVIDGRAVGPLSDEAVLARLDSGVIEADALVWRAGMTDWQPANESMPLIAKRVEHSLKNPQIPTRRDGLFNAAWR